MFRVRGGAVKRYEGVGIDALSTAHVHAIRHDQIPIFDDRPACLHGQTVPDRKALR
jgi:hypothetical protein